MGSQKARRLIARSGPKCKVSGHVLRRFGQHAPSEGLRRLLNDRIRSVFLHRDNRTSDGQQTERDNLKRLPKRHRLSSGGTHHL